MPHVPPPPYWHEPRPTLPPDYAKAYLTIIQNMLVEAENIFFDTHLNVLLANRGSKAFAYIRDASDEVLAPMVKVDHPAYLRAARKLAAQVEAQLHQYRGIPTWKIHGRMVEKRVDELLRRVGRNGVAVFRRYNMQQFQDTLDHYFDLDFGPVEKAPEYWACVKELRRAGYRQEARALRLARWQMAAAFQP